MARFVHLTHESAAKKIQRTGIRRNRTRFGVVGVYATPVMPNFYATHQWLRDLKRRGHRVIVGVYFKIPDEEVVMVGHYNNSHRSVMAAEAVDIVTRASDPRGYEVVIERSISPKEIHKIRGLPQVVGWRYNPDAHGNPPCACPVCLTPGEFKAADIRRRFGNE